MSDDRSKLLAMMRKCGPLESAPTIHDWEAKPSSNDPKLQSYINTADTDGRSLQLRARIYDGHISESSAEESLDETTNDRAATCRRQTRYCADICQRLKHSRAELDKYNVPDGPAAGAPDKGRVLERFTLLVEAAKELERLFGSWADTVEKP